MLGQREDPLCSRSGLQLYITEPKHPLHPQETIERHAKTRSCRHRPNYPTRGSSSTRILIGSIHDELVPGVTPPEDAFQIKLMAKLICRRAPVDQAEYYGECRQTDTDSHKKQKKKKSRSTPEETIGYTPISEGSDAVTSHIDPTLDSSQRCILAAAWHRPSQHAVFVAGIPALGTHRGKISAFQSDPGEHGG